MERSFAAVCILVLSAGIALLLSGCAQSLIQQGDSALKQGNYETAREQYRSAISSDPTDFRANRGLGQVYWHMKDYEKALEYLEVARSAEPEDGITNLYIGMVYEARAEFDKAETCYTGYLARNPGSKVSRIINGRLLYARNEKVRQQVSQALQYESTLVTDSSAAAVVGVLPFLTDAEDSSPLSSLGSGMAAAVTYDLFQIHSIRLVERLQLKYVLEELERVKSGLVSKESSPQLGKLLGASHLVNGSLSVMAADRVSVQSGIVETADSLYRMAIDSEEGYSRIMKLQKEVTFAIIDSLGIKLTPKERNAIEKLPTSSFDAFLAYSQGIEQLDMGNYESAKMFFDQAVAIDPDFDQATTLQEETDLLIDGGGTIDEFDFTDIGTDITADEYAGDDIVGDEVFDVAEPTVDPRTDDEPLIETGKVSVSGSIR